MLAPHQRTLFHLQRCSSISRGLLVRTFATATGRAAPSINQNAESDISRIRNVGIIAHIDAGKTTTTERMLYYSGQIRRIGNVDDGSTITDFLPTERARGVTIQSAAISFTWPLPPTLKDFGGSTNDSIEPHAIQLIDTPGHADFTFEVQRSLRVLDGAVCILDAVAGVEAQTEKVWFQASKYKIPKIIFVNKLDREGASFRRTVQHVATRLHVRPAVCHIPWWDQQGQLIGVGDAVNLRAITWQTGGDGKQFEVFSLDQLDSVDGGLASEIRKAREALVHGLLDEDVELLDVMDQAEEAKRDLSAAELTASLRRCVLDPDSTVVPIFAGASFRNIGVQCLLDAIVQLLPDPTEATNPGNSLITQMQTQNNVQKRGKQHLAVTDLKACALAFKVVHDPHKGVLVYVRVYSGALQPQSTLLNTTMQQYEKVPQLMRMYADSATAVSSISTGQIGVLPGLKITRTGDTLVQLPGPSSSQPPVNTASFQLSPIEAPPPVFFASIEPLTSGDEKGVRAALDILVREDPSLEITKDQETGQLRLNGMGEFHLEIAQDRLINHLKAKAKAGNIEISYRETILQPLPSELYAFTREQGGRQTRASCLVEVEPLAQSTESTSQKEHKTSFIQDGNQITIIQKATSPSHLDKATINSSLRNGALSTLSRGINYPYPVSDTHIVLTINDEHIFGTDTTPSALTSAASEATRKALKATGLKHGTALMELYMNVVISCDDTSLGAVVKDLSSGRSGQILSLDDGANTSGPVINDDVDVPHAIDLNEVYAPPDPFGGNGTDSGLRHGGHRSVVARVPLKEMIGYLKHLRSLTEGRGTFTMSPDRFERVVGMREKEILKEMLG